MKSVHQFYADVQREPSWDVPANYDALFDLHYETKDTDSESLYQKGKAAQWNIDTILDWSLSMDAENPLAYDDMFLPIYGSPLWADASEKRRAEIRRHYQAYTISQFLHGEQVALLAASRLVEVLPNIKAKMFAAQQAADEARHVELFNRLITEKIGLSYGIDASVKTLVLQGLSDKRWDFVVLTTQILIEGIALAALQNLREFSRSPLIAQAASYVMADEARHVSFGIKQLQPYFSQLTESELKERSDFTSEGMALLRQRLNPGTVWESLGIDIKDHPSLIGPSSTNRIVDKLFMRVRVMLDNLKLERRRSHITSQEQAQLASKRLEIWSRIDAQATF
jgi:hypothetical protein